MLSMKKITFLINSLTSGGAEKVLSVIITELIEQKFEVELLCIERDDVQPLPPEVKRVYLSSLTKYDSNIKKFIYLPYLALKLKKHIRKSNITLIQSHIYRANFINLLAKLFGSKHKAQVVEVTSIGYLMGGSLSQKINLFLVKTLYKYADMVIFKAKKMKSEYIKYINNNSSYTIIHNPYDIEKIERLACEPIDDFEFKKSKKYITTVSRLSKEKQHKKMMEALLELEESIELIIIGDGIIIDELEEYAKLLKLSKRVHFLGKKSNPFKYVKASDIFLLASKGEGFPNVLVEAMICGTPVISTDCISGPREILAPSTDIDFQLTDKIEIAQNGILYPVDKNRLLIEAIELLINNKELQKSYSKKGKLEAKRYALKKIVEEYKGVIFNKSQ